MKINHHQRAPVPNLASGEDFLLKPSIGADRPTKLPGARRTPLEDAEWKRESLHISKASYLREREQQLVAAAELKEWGVSDYSRMGMDMDALKRRDRGDPDDDEDEDDDDDDEDWIDVKADARNWNDVEQDADDWTDAQELQRMLGIEDPSDSSWR